MTKEDFKIWLDRPLTNTDEIIINTLLDMISTYDDAVKLNEDLLLKINKLQKKSIKENINDGEVEVLEVE